MCPIVYYLEALAPTSNSLPMTERRPDTTVLQCNSAFTAVDLKVLLVQISHEKRKAGTQNKRRWTD